MKTLLNTLFVTTQGSYLCKEGETVCVQQDGATKLRIPIHTLSGVVCFGTVSCSPFLMHAAAENGVGLSFLTEHGRFLARVQGPVNGNVLLRRKQYAASDDAALTGLIARSVVLGKVFNCRTVLQRAVRERQDGGDKSALEAAVMRLARISEDIERSCEVDSIRGYEGDAARVYFSVFDHLVVANKEHFFFRGRSRRPPLDNLNALLSFLYTLLTNDITGALESVGLDTAVGFLHRERPGRPSLALDLAEEFRPLLADRLALSLINRKQIEPSGFRKVESGAVVMDDETRKEVILAWQKRKQEELLHPFLQEKIALGMVPFVQSLLLSRFLRGDLDGYPCFFWR